MKIGYLGIPGEWLYSKNLAYFWPLGEVANLSEIVEGLCV